MMALILMFLIPLSPAHAAVSCDAVDLERMQKEIERINQRYDDFFRERREREEHAEHLQQGVPQVKIEQEARAKELEKARQAYRAVPKDYAKEEAMRLQWEAAQKEQVKKMELARLCEVQQKAKVEELLKKGRKIPELKEFDLDE
jgi:hypothetical protein